MKAQKKNIFDCVSEIRTVKSLGLPTNPLFEKKRLDAIEFIQKNQLIEQIRRQAPQDSPLKTPKSNASATPD